MELSFGLARGRAPRYIHVARANGIPTKREEFFVTKTRAQEIGSHGQRKVMIWSTTARYGLVRNVSGSSSRMSATDSCTLSTMASLVIFPGRQAFLLRSRSACAARICVRQKPVSFLQRSTNCSVVTGVGASAAEAMLAPESATKHAAKNNRIVMATK